MVTRLSFFSGIVSCTVALNWLSGLPSLAGDTIKVTPPLTTAKTIQVTEIWWAAQDGPTPGPLRKTGTMAICIERPDKFRVEWKETNSSHPMTYFVSDGKTMVSYDGKQFRSQPAATAEWPGPVIGLMNNSPGPVSATLANRNGKKVLRALLLSPSGHQEYLFDPSTHLHIRDMVFLTWQGKTSEVSRTEYTGWLLNKPLSPSVFRAPSFGTKHKDD